MGFFLSFSPLQAISQIWFLQEFYRAVWSGCSAPRVLPAFKGPHSLDDTGYGDLVAGRSVSKYADVSPSLDTTRCFGDSEPDDSCWSCQTLKLAHASCIFCPLSSTDSHRVNGANPFVAWLNPPSKCALRVYPGCSSQQELSGPKL